MIARLGIALGGIALGGVAQLAAQVAPPVTTSEFQAWISAGGATIATGGLVYITRLFASGNLVFYPVKKLHDEAKRRETQLHDALAKSHEREGSYQRILLNRLGVRPDDV